MSAGGSVMPAPGGQALTLALLDAGHYHDAAGSAVSADDRLSIAGQNYRDQYSALRTAHPELRNRIYGHAVRDKDGSLWLQYWFFYFYNDYHLAFDIGLHEGDWEMIQLHLAGAPALLNFPTDRRLLDIGAVDRDTCGRILRGRRTHQADAVLHASYSPSRLGHQSCSAVTDLLQGTTAHDAA